LGSGEGGLEQPHLEEVASFATQDIESNSVLNMDGKAWTLHTASGEHAGYISAEGKVISAEGKVISAEGKVGKARSRCLGDH